MVTCLPVMPGLTVGAAATWPSITIAIWWPWFCCMELSNRAAAASVTVRSTCHCPEFRSTTAQQTSHPPDPESARRVCSTPQRRPCPRRAGSQGADDVPRLAATQTSARDNRCWSDRNRWSVVSSLEAPRRSYGDDSCSDAAAQGGDDESVSTPRSAPGGHDRCRPDGRLARIAVSAIAFSVWRRRSWTSASSIMTTPCAVVGSPDGART